MSEVLEFSARAPRGMSVNCPSGSRAWRSARREGGALRSPVRRDWVTGRSGGATDGACAASRPANSFRICQLGRVCFACGLPGGAWLDCRADGFRPHAASILLLPVRGMARTTPRARLDSGGPRGDAWPRDGMFVLHQAARVPGETSLGDSTRITGFAMSDSPTLLPQWSSDRVSRSGSAVLPFDSMDWSCRRRACKGPRMARPLRVPPSERAPNTGSPVDRVAFHSGTRHSARRSKDGRACSLRHRAGNAGPYAKEYRPPC
jgi:hypothetical protein